MGTQLTLPKKGAEHPQFSAHVCIKWPDGWMDQDATWQGDRFQPKRHCVRWGASSPPPKGGRAPNFWPISVMAKWLDHGWMPLGRDVGLSPRDIMSTWHGGRPHPKRHCVRWGPSSPSPKGNRAPANFRPMYTVARRLDGSRCHLA